MASFELLSDQDLRLDGRRAGELRRLRCRLGVFGQADGSAYLEMGNTKVLAAVYGPHEARGAARARSDWRSILFVPVLALMLCSYSCYQGPRRPRSCELPVQHGRVQHR